MSLEIGLSYLWAMLLISPPHQQSRTAFEVAAIKQADTTLQFQIRGMSCHGTDGVVGHPLMQAGLGRCRVVGWNVKSIVSAAYGYGMDRISGAPSWAETLPYTIDAKAPEPFSYTRAQLMQMFQPLLEDRFKLKFHLETKEVNSYDLSVAASGSKLTMAAPDARPGSTARPSEAFGRSSLSTIISLLSNIVHAPVVDKTGLVGLYEYKLSWDPDADIMPNSPLAEASAIPDPRGPSIFTAVQEQLGLRLSPTKIKIEILVIDSIEKATDN